MTRCSAGWAVGWVRAKASKIFWTAIAAALAFTGPAPVADVDWSRRAVVDLEAVQQLISDNHPGPVDPQNPGFKDWMQTGYAEALKKARLARSPRDYERAIGTYVSGFRDGHVAFRANFGVEPQVSPGFMTRTDDSGRTVVKAVLQDSPVPIGAELKSCDGETPGQLLDRLIYSVYLNPDIPWGRDVYSTFLFSPNADDTAGQFKTCTFSINGKTTTVTMKWRPIAKETLFERLMGKALPKAPPRELGVRQIDGVWFVSIPSFGWNDDRAHYEAFLKELESKLPLLRSADRVVIDVRGNGGGNSTFGDDLGDVLFGAPTRQAITESFDWTVDWRASKRNLKALRKAAAEMPENDRTEFAEVVEGLEAALRDGKNFYREIGAPKPLPKLKRPHFAGKILFLTDRSCASACLDFADMILRVPGVVHIGLPTSADSVYMDVNVVDLPSGVARLVYPMKVYRHRLRGNNRWYEPKLMWPGGEMTDAEVAAWVKLL